MVLQIEIPIASMPTNCRISMLLSRFFIWKYKIQEIEWKLAQDIHDSNITESLCSTALSEIEPLPRYHPFYGKMLQTFIDAHQDENKIIADAICSLNECSAKVKIYWAHQMLYLDAARKSNGNQVHNCWEWNK